MKYFISLLLFFSYSPDTLSQSINCDATQLIAHYQVQGSSQDKQQLSLLRYQQQVVIRQQDKPIFELWHLLPNQQVQLIRYFSQQQRGIEYQPTDLTHSLDWQQHYSLIAEQQITAMNKESESGSSCEKVERYQRNNAKEIITAEWLPALKLLKSYRVSTTKAPNVDKVFWQLTHIEQQSAVILSQLKQWQQWPTIDYSDIGDNEDDPFLAKMINQGFIEHPQQQFVGMHQH